MDATAPPRNRNVRSAAATDRPDQHRNDSGASKPSQPDPPTQVASAPAFGHGGTGSTCRDSENCGAQLQLDTRGASASYQHTTVEAVGTPPKSDISFGVDVGYSYGTSTSGDQEYEMKSGALSVIARLIMGSEPFPGREGGSWNGLAIGGVFSATSGDLESSMDIDISSLGGENDRVESSGSVKTTLIGGDVGYQYLNFQSMNASTLKQSGYGIFLGLRVGKQKTSMKYEMKLPGTDEPKKMDNDREATSFGPIVTLSFPTYNAGTAQVSQFYLNGMIMPTGDFLFGTIAGGYSY